MRGRIRKVPEMGVKETKAKETKVEVLLAEGVTAEKTMAGKTIDVLGLGNPLMDFLLEVNEEILQELQMRKGEMHLLNEPDELDNIGVENIGVERIHSFMSKLTSPGTAYFALPLTSCIAPSCIAPPSVPEPHLSQVPLSVPSQVSSPVSSAAPTPASRFRPLVLPGGSVANTLRLLSLLGGKSLFCGKVGNDENGKLFLAELQQQGVEAKLTRHGSLGTGQAVTFITPDAERTFCTYLGAAAHFSREDLLEAGIEAEIANSRILHLEGYQLEGPAEEALWYAAELAEKHGSIISLDLGDAGVIRRNRERVRHFLQKIGILFLNEAEALELAVLLKTALPSNSAPFSNQPPHSSSNYSSANPIPGPIPGSRSLLQGISQELCPRASIIVLKLGENGSLLYSKVDSKSRNKEGNKEGKIHKIPCHPAQAVDTTGAGDSYAAGFLYGYCRGWPAEKAALLGAAVAARVVEQTGVRIAPEQLEQLRRSLKD